MGVETIDADDIVHGLVPEDERRRLAKVVFKDPAARRELEARIHPLVKAKIDEWLATLNSQLTTHNSKLKIAIIPLLFEVHWEANYDIILCVVSSRENQIERMTASRGYTREEAEARISAQMDVEEKAARSHYVIRNDGSPSQLREEAARMVAWLKEQEKT